MTTKFGVYLGPGANGVARLSTFSSWLGRAPDHALDFFANDTWPSLESDSAWACACWAQSGVPAVFSVPLTVNGTTLNDVATGLHDSSFIAVGKALVANGQGSAILRLGWEFNGSWMPWSAASNPADYTAAYRRVALLLRAISPAFTFDWCTSFGTNSISPEHAYPGDDVVDYIGMDLYDRYYTPALADFSARWSNYLSAPNGLNWLVSFAAAQHKRISIPEWGTGEWLVADGGTGGGDNAAFITNMAAFMAANNVAYSSYWDISAGGYNAAVSDGEHPLAGAALKAAVTTTAVPVPAPGPILWIGAGEPSTRTSVSVNFSPPYGGGTADHYLVEYRPTSWTAYGTTKSVGTTPLVNLTPGTTYEVRVTAVNAGGSGTPSAALTTSTLP